MIRSLARLVAVLALSGVPAAADTGWPSFNNQLDSQRYSALDQITRRNVGMLAPVCAAKVADASAFEAGPLVIDGMIYLTAGRTTLALDARNCAERWRYEHAPEAVEPVPVNRGVAYLDGHIFRGTADGRLLALDARTGALLWKTAPTNPANGEYLSAAPIAWNGLVFIGTAGGDLGIKGRMMAFDAATGREEWTFDTIPTGKERGAETWRAVDTAAQGGGGSWTSYTLDPATGELFVPVGNPAPALNPAYRPGDNLFTDSMVVLDARTGRLKWWYQVKPADGADHDMGAAPALYRMSDGRRVMLMAGKDGYAYAIDRTTHRLLFKTEVTTIRNITKAPTPEGVMVCPGVSGGVKWNGPAIDPARKTVFVPATDWCNILKVATPSFVPLQPFWGGSFLFDPAPGAANGWITALDSDTGAVRWRYHLGAMTSAAVTPTAGGVVFAGDAKGEFLALDSGTGAVLFRRPMGGALAGGIVTYALDGRQFVAFDTGNVSRSGNELAGTPTFVIMALGDGRQPAAARTQDTASLAEAALRPGDPAHGAALYGQTCVSCHGIDGTMVPGHSLRGLGADRIVGQVQNPKAPMPKLYPTPFGRQDVADVAAYVSLLPAGERGPAPGQ